MAIVTIRQIDKIRRLASGQLDQTHRGNLGQFMTSSDIAVFMASFFQHWPEHTRLLDPGAGVGSLTEAFVGRFLEKTTSTSKLDLTAYEIEPILGRYLQQRLIKIERENQDSEHVITHNLFERDFIVGGAFAASFGVGRYTHIILNPPYKKIAANSNYRKLLHELGIEAPNLYVAFLALSILLAENGGEIVAIIPRSFCNGLYFRPFRKWLFKHAALAHIHVFESRKKAFQDDNVLQENVIIRLVKGTKQAMVTISESKDSTLEDYTERLVPVTDVVNVDDSEMYIRIPTANINGSASLFRCTLQDMGLEVATGPIVDFRVKDHLLEGLAEGAAPLLYAHHFAKGEFRWPRAHKKPNAITVTSQTRKLLMPQGWYVVTKRFSSKEEKRRIVAHVVDPKKLPYSLYGFENHLNIIHTKKQGLTADLVHGLAMFLNSTIVDTHFRTFSGHTQVNATDLRTMRFPIKRILSYFGQWAQSQNELTHEKIDAFIEAYAAQ